MPRRKRTVAKPDPTVEEKRNKLAEKLNKAYLDLGILTYAYFRATDLAAGTPEVRLQDLDDRMNEVGILLKRLREMA